MLTLFLLYGRLNMPKKLHNKLKREARKKFGSTTSTRARKYIYGTMNKIEKRKKRKRKK